MSTDPKHREPEEPASDSLDGDRPTLPVEIGPDELPMELDSPEAIGPYRIVEVLGEGGMGVVYRGHQSEPFDREVAVKVIKAGMDTKEVLRRFDLERRTLAKLQHEGIAQVLDAGSTDDGRPYFVMECAIGLPITDYCDRERSSIRDRLLLFVEVCRALQHAHQRGILHRDIKPSNVLVVEREGRAVPKVIDFGLARATSREEDGETTMTQAGQILGTPAYMSPEQAGSGAYDVDSRT
ncbi:MAG: serine/threonine-protein kinase, partial [Planctomycetota bacterium]